LMHGEVSYASMLRRCVVHKPDASICRTASRMRDAHRLPRAQEEMLGAMNAALNTMGMKVTAAAADPAAWTVSDGKKLLRRYTDDMVIPPAAGQVRAAPRPKRHSLSLIWAKP
jgi:hypothetical protein